MSSRRSGTAPAVSVVVPNYNYGRYLTDCLESILAQTFEDLEVIVVDDGSDDDSIEVLGTYDSNPRLTWIAQTNHGSAHAKNRGIEAARGEFVAFLDADDIWKPTKLAKQVALFSDPAVGVVYSRAGYIDPEGSLIKGPERGKRLQPRSGDVTSHLIYDNFIMFSTSIVRRSLLRQVNGCDESLQMAMDWDLWLRLSLTTRFEFVDEKLLYYRIGHPGQMSQNSALRSQCSDVLIARFVQEHPEWSALVRRATAYRYAVRGYRMRSNNLSGSTKCYREALSLWPFETAAFKGLFRNYLARYVSIRK